MRMRLLVPSIFVKNQGQLGNQYAAYGLSGF